MRRACWIVLLEFLLVIAASRVARGQGPAPLNLVGVWQAHFSTPLGPAVSQTILMPDGSFTKTVRAGGMMTWDAGMYSVGQGYIHFYIHDHEPKIYKGVRMHWVTSETVFFHMTGPRSDDLRRSRNGQPLAGLPRPVMPHTCQCHHSSAVWYFILQQTPLPRFGPDCSDQPATPWPATCIDRDGAAIKTGAHPFLSSRPLFR